MQRSGSSVNFLVLVMGAVFFIWVTGQSLPARVASHFGATGVANGFMPREFYVLFMIIFVVVLPSTLVLLTNLLLSHPSTHINLPNREYWLAPARRAESIGFLQHHLMYFGVMLVIFLCYVHWLVVRANAMVPPSLSALWFMGGLGVFLVATLIWTVALFRRFS